MEINLQRLTLGGAFLRFSIVGATFGRPFFISLISDTKNLIKNENGRCFLTKFVIQ